MAKHGDGESERQIAFRRRPTRVRRIDRLAGAAGRPREVRFGRTRVAPTSLANDFRREVQAALDADLPVMLGPYAFEHLIEVAVSLGVARLLGSMLAQVSTADPAAFAVATGVLVLVAVLGGAGYRRGEQCVSIRSQR